MGVRTAIFNLRFKLERSNIYYPAESIVRVLNSIEALNYDDLYKLGIRNFVIYGSSTNYDKLGVFFAMTYEEGSLVSDWMKEHILPRAKLETLVEKLFYDVFFLDRYHIVAEIPPMIDRTFEELDGQIIVISPWNVTKVNLVNKEKTADLVKDFRELSEDLYKLLTVYELEVQRRLGKKLRLQIETYALKNAKAQVVDMSGVKLANMLEDAKAVVNFEEETGFSFIFKPINPELYDEDAKNVTVVLYFDKNGMISQLPHITESDTTYVMVVSDLMEVGGLASLFIFVVGVLVAAEVITTLIGKLTKFIELDYEMYYENLQTSEQILPLKEYEDLLKKTTEKTHEKENPFKFDLINTPIFWILLGFFLFGALIIYGSRSLARLLKGGRKDERSKGRGKGKSEGGRKDEESEEHKD